MQVNKNGAHLIFLSPQCLTLEKFNHLFMANILISNVKEIIIQFILKFISILRNGRS